MLKHQRGDEHERSVPCSCQLAGRYEQSGGQTDCLQEQFPQPVGLCRVYWTQEIATKQSLWQLVHAGAFGYCKLLLVCLHTLSHLCVVALWLYRLIRVIVLPGARSPGSTVVLLDPCLHMSLQGSCYLLQPPVYSYGVHVP